MNRNPELSQGDIINFNCEVKGIFRNITEFEHVGRSKNDETIEEKQAPVRNPEPDYTQADEIKDKETSGIKSKIKEIVIARGSVIQYKEFEPTKFFVSMTAEYNPEDNPESVSVVLTSLVENELNRQIINETERRKENGA